jgi:hypothetical protein
MDATIEKYEQSKMTADLKRLVRFKHAHEAHSQYPYPDNAIHIGFGRYCSVQTDKEFCEYMQLPYSAFDFSNTGLEYSFHKTRMISNMDVVNAIFA